MIKLNQSRKFRKYYNKLIPGGSTFSKVEYFNDQNVPFALSRCKDAKVYDIPIFFIPKLSCPEPLDTN